MTIRTIQSLSSPIPRSALAAGLVAAMAFTCADALAQTIDSPPQVTVRGEGTFQKLSLNSDTHQVQREQVQVSISRVITYDDLDLHNTPAQDELKRRIE